MLADDEFFIEPKHEPSEKLWVDPVKEINSREDRKSVDSTSNKQAIQEAFSRTSSVSKMEDIYDKLTNHLGLNDISSLKLKDSNFIKTLQELMSATTSGQLFYLRLLRRALENISNPTVIKELVMKIKGWVDEETLLGLIVIFKTALNERKLDSPKSRSRGESFKKTDEQFFNYFLDFYMTRDLASRKLIEKLTAPRLIKLRQTTLLKHLDYQGELTREIVDKYCLGARSFLEIAGQQIDKGCAKMTPSGIRKVCQILLPLCHLIVGETASYKITQEIRLDTGETFLVQLVPEAIALAYSLINEVNLDSAIELSQQKFKTVIADFDGKQNKLLKKVTPFLFDNKDLMENASNAAFDLDIVMTPLEALKEQLKKADSRTLINSLTTTIREDFIATVQNDLRAMLKIIGSNKIRYHYFLDILKPVQDYHYYLCAKKPALETESREKFSLVSDCLDVFLKICFTLTDDGVDERFIKKFTTYDEIVSLKEQTRMRYCELVNQHITDDSELLKDAIYRFDSHVAKILNVINLYFEVQKDIQKLSLDNFNQQLGVIRKNYKKITTNILAEKSRDILREGSDFQALMLQLSKISNTYDDIALLKKILADAKYDKLSNLENKKFAAAIQSATNLRQLYDKDIKKILSSLKKPDLKKLLELENTVLGTALYEAALEGYSFLSHSDIVTIMQCLISRDLKPLTTLHNELGYKLYCFLNNHIRLKENLQLSPTLAFKASVIKSSLYLMPNRLIIHIIKRVLKNQPLPTGEDLIAISEGLPIQQAHNLESTLRQLLSDVFKDIPSLSRAFDNTHFTLLQSIGNFFEQKQYWLFSLNYIKDKIEAFGNKLPTIKLMENSKTILKKLNEHIAKWQLFQDSMSNSFQSNNFSERFKKEWDKSSFKDLWTFVINRHYKNDNAFLLYVKFLIHYTSNKYDTNILKNIAIDCDSIIRKGLMDTTKAAIEQMAKPEDKRPIIKVNENTENLTDLLDQKIKFLGTNEKIPDYKREERYYSEFLKDSFIGLAFPDTIKATSDFAAFLKTIKVGKIIKENSNTQLDVSLDRLQATHLPKEWNKAIYHRIMKLLLLETDIPPSTLLTIGLPLAVNAKDTIHAKTLISNFIANSKSWPVIPALKEVFKSLRSELGFDCKVLLSVIDDENLNASNNYKKQIEESLKIVGPFDISIFTAIHDVNLIVQAVQTCKYTMALLLIKHCLNHYQAYPLLDAFFKLPATSSLYILELQKSLNLLGINTAYETAVKSFKTSSGQGPLSTIMLPLALDIKNNELINRAIGKIIKAQSTWPLLDEIKSVLKKSITPKDNRSKLVESVAKNDLETLNKLLQSASRLDVTYLAIEGQNLLRIAMRSNSEIFNTLMNFCIANNESYPLLDLLLADEITQLTQSEYHSEVLVGLERLRMIKALREYKATDLLSRDGTLAQDTLMNAIRFSAATGNTLIMRKATLRLVGFVSFNKIADTLNPFFEKFHLNNSWTEQFTKAMEQDDTVLIEKLLLPPNHLNLSIMTAHDVNPLAIAFKQVHSTRLIKFIINICVASGQVLPLADALKLKGITAGEKVRSAFIYALARLGIEKIESLNVKIDLKKLHQQERECSFFDLYAFQTSSPIKNLLDFQGFHDEFMKLYTKKLDLINNYSSYKAFVKFTTLLKNISNSNTYPTNVTAFAKSLLIKMRTYLLKHPHLIPFLNLTNEKYLSDIAESDKEKIRTLRTLFDITLDRFFAEVLEDHHKQFFNAMSAFFYDQGEAIRGHIIKQLTANKGNIALAKEKNLTAFLQQLCDATTTNPLAQQIFSQVKEFVLNNKKQIHNTECLALFTKTSIKTVATNQHAAQTTFFASNNRLPQEIEAKQEANDQISPSTP